MPSQKKSFTVANLTAKLKDAKALVLADYRGLSVEQMTELRQKLAESGGQLEVVKNRLLSLAAKEAKVSLDQKSLAGPTAAVWANEDEMALIKTLYKFSQENELPKIKSGLFEGQIITAEKVKTLAKLPGLDQLRAKLVGSLQSPAYGLVNSLRWNLSQLVYVLKAVEKNQGGGES
jgi:large subunit ribosomal protein L10